MTDCHTNRYHVDIPIFIQISEVKGPGDRLSHKQISCWYPYLSIQISEVKGPGDRLSHNIYHVDPIFHSDIRGKGQVTLISCWYPYLYSDIRGKGSRWQTVTQTDIMLISLSFHSDIRGKGSKVTDCHTNRYHVDIPIFIQISEVKGPGDRLSHKQISCWYPYLYSDIRGKGSRWQTVTQTDIMLISLSFHSDIRGKGSQVTDCHTNRYHVDIPIFPFRYQR